MIAERSINISEEYRKIALQGEPIFDNSQYIVIISMQSYKTYEELAKAKHNANIWKCSTGDLKKSTASAKG